MSRLGTPDAAAMYSKFTYQNVMYAAAGKLIELESGMSWGRFVERRIFKPLGMKRSVASLARTRLRDNVATPHDYVAISPTMSGFQRGTANPVQRSVNRRAASMARSVLPAYRGPSRVNFEWDPEKAGANLDKHQISFHEAATVFGDPQSTTFPTTRTQSGRWCRGDPRAGRGFEGRVSTGASGRPRSHFTRSRPHQCRRARSLCSSTQTMPGLGHSVLPCSRDHSDRNAWMTSTRAARAAGTSDARIAAATSMAAAASRGSAPEMLKSGM